MKQFLSAALVGLAVIGTTASAQPAPSTDPPSPPAVASDKGDSNTASAPVAGKNSFTEAQARERLEKHGYTEVSALKKDDKSVWRGTAMKSGKQVDVAVDFEGNVVGQ
ncbi:MAG TPA: PepSY domain-containing protein [Aliidongia sp.]|nr:PepSY domain-containing protein [Aliidongia sp.]